MAFEIPVDVSYFSHPKTLKLISILGRVEADVYPLRLWAWAAEYARDGRLPDDCRVTERGVGWKGGSGRLVAALVEAGFIEVGGVLIHDWDQHAGRAIFIYEQKKRKQREKWAKSSGILPEDHRQNSPNPGCPTQDKKDGIREIGAVAPVPQPSAVGITPKDEASRQLTKTAIDVQHSPNAPETLGRTIKAMASRHGGEKVHAWLMDPANKGKNVNEMQDELNGPKTRPGDIFKPAATKCGNCGGTGKVAGGVKDGKVLQVPCQRCQKLRVVQ